MLMVLVSYAVIEVNPKLNDMSPKPKETQPRESLVIRLLNSNSMSRWLMALTSS